MDLQAVTTTGIYCRAGCGARPRPDHVRAMPNAAAAMAAGYRPCLLCRPDRLPDLGVAPKTVELEHALRLIAEGYLDAHDTDALARRIGYSTRHLVRLFGEHVGATPDFVARARRAHLARRLLDESDLTVTRVALAAGFASVRQMNRVVRELFGFSPTELRAKRSRTAALDPLDGGLRLRVPFRGPLDVRRALAHLGARAIRGVEAFESGRYLRTMNVCGHPGVIEIGAGDDDGHLEVTMHLPTFGSIIDEVARVRALFGLDRDPTDAERHLRADPVLGPCVRAGGGVRLPGAWDRFETGVRIIIGQQVSVAGAATVAGQLTERHGRTIDTALPGGLRRLFPSADALAVADPGDFAMPRRRAMTIRAFARAVADGDLDLTSAAPLPRTLETLQAIPGIGPWSAHLIAARVMGHADAFPASDLGLRRGAAALLGSDEPLTTRALEELAERWHPFRTTAAAHLWMTAPAVAETRPAMRTRA